MNNNFIEKNPLKSYNGKTIKLIDLCDSITDCNHSTPKWMNDGKIVIRSFNIKKGKLLLTEVSYTDEISFQERIFRSKPNPGDLIITREAPMGEVCIIPDGIECCLGQRLVLIKPNLDKINNHYLLYALLSEHAQKQIRQSDNTGSTVSNLRIPDLKNIKIPLNENQDKIADVLSTLDAKIELNNRINAELESLAKTIYDYWFVQFDFPYDFDRSQPDEHGKPYKSSGGKMVWSDTLDRAIPAGWEVGKLGDIGRNIRNGIRETDLTPEMSYIGLEHIPRKQISLDSWSKAVDLASNKYLFVRRNILFGKLRPYFHKVGVAFISGVCSTDILVLDSKEESYFGYFLMLVSSDDFIQYVSSATEGTRMPRTSWEYVKNYPIPIPEYRILKKFDNILKPMISKMENNVYQNQQLTQLRDWLLPMLMNGQVRVK